MTERSSKSKFNELEEDIDRLIGKELHDAKHKKSKKGK
jgi:hypothetical protein